MAKLSGPFKDYVPANLKFLGDLEPTLTVSKEISTYTSRKDAFFLG